MPARLFAQMPRELARLEGRDERRPVTLAADVARGARLGLSLRGGYAPGKVPVVFIHGLLATPQSWQGMIAALEADPALGRSYQFWTFGYEAGDPIPFSAWLLRQSLLEARERFDRENAEPQFDRVVLVGHSMGGLLAKMTVVDSGTRLWRDVSDRPFDELAGEPNDREVLGQALLSSRSLECAALCSSRHRIGAAGSARAGCRAWARGSCGGRIRRGWRMTG